MNDQSFAFGAIRGRNRQFLAARPAISGTFMAALLAFSALAVSILLLLSRLTVERSDWQFLLVSACISGLAAARIAMRDPASLHQRRLRDAAECILLFLSMSALGGIASYAAATGTSGFADAQLEHADRLLRFDWVAWYVAVVRHPVLQSLGAAAYGSVYVSPLILIGYLTWSGRLAQARRFLLTYWLAIVLTLALFPLFPARGTLAFLWHGPIPYMPTNGVFQAAIIPALRAHQLTVIDFANFRGLVCAPSFHTVCGVLFIVFAWPDRRLRWPLVPLNLAMLLATPVEGTHYLSDMVLGALVAVAAIGAIGWGSAWLAARDRRSALRRAFMV